MRNIGGSIARGWLAFALPALIPVAALAQPLVLEAPPPQVPPATTVAPPPNPLADPRLSNGKILVLPFQPVNPAENNAWVGKSIQESLVADLTVTSPDRVASASALAATFDDAVAIGRQHGARYVVIGGFVTVDRELRITGQVLDVETGKAVGGLKVTGEPSQIFQMEDGLAMQVKSQLLMPNQEPVLPPPPQTEQPQPQQPQAINPQFQPAPDQAENPAPPPAYTSYQSPPAPTIYGADGYTPYASYPDDSYGYTYPSYAPSYDYGWCYPLGFGFCYSGFYGHYGRHHYGYDRAFRNNGGFNNGFNRFNSNFRSASLNRGANTFRSASVARSGSNFHATIANRSPSFVGRSSAYTHNSIGRTSSFSHSSFGGSHSSGSFHSGGGGGSFHGGGSSHGGGGGHSGGGGHGGHR